MALPAAAGLPAAVAPLVHAPRRILPQVAAVDYPLGLAARAGHTQVQRARVVEMVRDEALERVSECVCACVRVCVRACVRACASVQVREEWVSACASVQVREWVSA